MTHAAPLTWRDLLGPLAESGRRAIAPDLPGFGGSAPTRTGAWEDHMEAVEEFRGDADPELREVRIELPIDAHLPHEYVPSERLRLEMYKHLAAVRTADWPRIGRPVLASWRDGLGNLRALFTWRFRRS